MILTAAQLREARELLGWSRAELSFRARLPLAATEVIEDHGSTSMLPPGHIAAIVNAFEGAGLTFSLGGPRLKGAL